LKVDFPTLSLATVYNTLEILKNIGEVVELTLDKNKVRYDPDTSIHDHILCVKCRKVEDVPAINESVYLKNLNIEGYRILGISNQFHGVCSECE
jgi:Fur family peroxide stress response transcriptional regulator